MKLLVLLVFFLTGCTRGHHKGDCFGSTYSTMDHLSFKIIEERSHGAIIQSRDTGDVSYMSYEEIDRGWNEIDCYWEEK